MGLLDSKVALITGGTKNIGKAIVLEFAREGASLAITYHADDAAADAVRAECEAFGCKVMLFKTDASSFAEAHDVVDKVVAEFGRIDVLVNNAGMVKDGLLLRMSEAEFDKVVNVNLKSVFNYTHAAAPYMIRARKGSIINMSSVVGITGNAGQCNYAASKAGIIGFSKSVAKELGSRGVRSNCIAPGFIDSDMTAAMSDKMKEYALGQISMRRAGSVEEVAGVALFLASDLSGYVSGQVVNCDGAMV